MANQTIEAAAEAFAKDVKAAVARNASVATVRGIMTSYVKELRASGWIIDEYLGPRGPVVRCVGCGRIEPYSAIREGVVIPVERQIGVVYRHVGC